MNRDREPAPELLNREQEDEDTQAQTLADEALAGRDATMGAGDTEKVTTGDDSDDSQDLVDHMNQMVTSGRIDMSAFRGERSDDDEDGMLGEDGMEDDFPRGSDGSR